MKKKKPSSQSELELVRELGVTERLEDGALGRTG